MTIDIFMITEAEMNIMEIIWASDHPKTTTELSAAIYEHHSKQIKPSTIHTLCERLMKKGFLTYIQTGGRNVYLPLIHKDIYRYFVAKLLIAKLFNDSAVELVSSLLCDYDMSRETLCELKEMLESVLTQEQSDAAQKPQTGQPKQHKVSFAPSGSFIMEAACLSWIEFIPIKRRTKAHMPRAA